MSETSNQTLRVFIIGAGAISRFHAQAAGAMPLATELHVADPNPSARQGFAQKYPVARLYNDAREMLQTPARADDVVIVATPPFVRHELARLALQSGRHTLCEKPLAMNLAEAVDLLKVARQVGRHLACCSSRFRGLATTAKARQLLHSGELGRPYHLTFVHRFQRSRTGIEYQPSTTWFLNRRFNGGGTLMDWGPYDFAAMHELLQPVRLDVLAAWMSCPQTALNLPPKVVFDVEQQVGAHLRYTLADGSTCEVRYERCACTHGRAESVQELEGATGAVSWDWLDHTPNGEVRWSRDAGGKPELVRFTPQEGPSPGPHHRPLTFLYAAMQGRSHAGLLNEDAVFTFACLRAVYDCVEQSRPQTVETGSLAP
jgi:predicted dehydrogenase